LYSADFGFHFFLEGCEGRCQQLGDFGFANITGRVVLVLEETVARYGQEGSKPRLFFRAAILPCIGPRLVLALEFQLEGGTGGCPHPLVVKEKIVAVAVVILAYICEILAWVGFKVDRDGKPVLILGKSDHALNLQFSAVVCQDSR
jgi:hypothetical protein